MRMLVALLALLSACAGESTAPPTPPTRQYALTSLTYEDVYPGNYAATLAEFAGGPARMGFGDASGELIVETEVIGVMVVTLPDSSSTEQSVNVLPAGSFGFSFAIDSLGVVVFQSGPPLWSLSNGAVLTDSLYSFDQTECFNDTCTDYIRLAFAWERLP